MSRRERFGRCLVVVAWMALITYWSDQGSLPIDQPMVATALHGFQHRFAHLVAFGLLALLARWAFESVPRGVILAIVLTSIFGAVDELHQAFVPGRRSAIDDWAFDTLSGGLAIGMRF